jgi:hypothetical protein
MAQAMLEMGRERERIKKARDTLVMKFYTTFSYRSSFILTGRANLQQSVQDS